MRTDSHFRTVAVVVNWNGVELLRHCLPTVLQQSLPFWRVVVVDNGSRDASLQFLDQQLAVETIREPANLGFAGAANRGIMRALQHPQTDLVAILNNDVALERDWHEEAQLVLRERPGLAGCATCLLDQGRPARVDTAGIEWREDGWAENYLNGEPPPDRSTPPRAVYGVSAAAGVFRRALFESVGLFDESFFAYQEDVDLALRARSRGWEFMLAPGARGQHFGHASNRAFPVCGTWADFYNARNRLVVLAKSLPADQWRHSWKQILKSHLAALARSLPEGRGAAVLAGAAQGISLLPFAFRARYKPSATGSRRQVRVPWHTVNAGPQLSVVIIALDVADVLADALGSLPDGAEVVVADGGSSDDTTKIARRLGARVIPQDLAAVRRAHGVFDVARNAAASQARGEWILHLDADERLSPALAREIADLVAGQPEGVAYEMPRLNLFWGRPVRLLGPDYQLRLVRRGLGRFSAAQLHQRMLVDGNVGRLQSALIHLNVKSWRDVTMRFRRDVPVQARTLGRRPRLAECLLRPLHLFRFYYGRNGAFRDGLRGLAVSGIYASYEAAILWRARRNQHAPS